MDFDTPSSANDGDFNTPSLAHDGDFNAPSLAHDGEFKRPLLSQRLYELVNHSGVELREFAAVFSPRAPSRRSRRHREGWSCGLHLRLEECLLSLFLSVCLIFLFFSRDRRSVRCIPPWRSTIAMSGVPDVQHQPAAARPQVYSAAPSDSGRKHGAPPFAPGRLALYSDAGTEPLPPRPRPSREQRRPRTPGQQACC